MKITKMRRSKLLGSIWLSYAGEGGNPAMKETGWRRLLNINGFGFNHKDNSYWIEFRRHA